MAKLPRIVARIFGSGSGVDQIAQFGSLFAGTPAFTTDPAVAQSLSNWLDGWFSAAIGGNAPAIEDMNSVCFVLAYQIAYQMQSGIPEWDSGTTYFIGSLANSATGVTYVSKTDSNSGNILTNTTHWKKVGGDILTTLGDLLYAGSNGDATRVAGNITTVKNFLSQTGDGANSAAPVWTPYKTMTSQTFPAGASGTYATPTNPSPLYIEFELQGAGGGGGGASNGGGQGSAGGDSTFGAYTAGGGLGAGTQSSTGQPGGAGGAASGPSGELTHGAPGNGGGAGTFPNGGGGGSSPYGGAGGGGTGNSDALPSSAGTGSGGGGSGGANVAGAGGSGGGGAGATIKDRIYAPASTYAYSIGSGGPKGTGTRNGTDGSGGKLTVREYYI